MRTLIALTALTFSLFSAGQAQGVRAPVRLSLVAVAAVATPQLPTRMTLPVRGQATAVTVSPTITGPLNTIINPPGGEPTTPGKWCHWFPASVYISPAGGWVTTSTTGIFNGVPSVLYCRGAVHSTAQSAAVITHAEEFFQAP